MTSLLSVIRLDLAASCCSVGVSLICNQHLLHLGKVLSLCVSLSLPLSQSQPVYWFVSICANLCMIYAIFMFQALTNNECSNHSFGSLGSSSDKESEVCSVTFLANIHILLLKHVLNLHNRQFQFQGFTSDLRLITFYQISSKCTWGMAFL